METLELKYLAPYLPYKLKLQTDIYDCKFLSSQQIFTYDRVNCVHFFHPIPGTKFTKPVLRPLSDLTKEIEHNGERFVLIEWLEDKFHAHNFHKQCERIIEDERWINHCDYLLIQYLLEWHFDVFNLIERNLAVDINTIK